MRLEKFKRLRTSAILAGVSVGALASATAAAHSISSSNPRFINTDGNGVDLVDGSFNFSVDEGSIGSGDAKLALVRTFGASG